MGSKHIRRFLLVAAIAVWGILLATFLAVGSRGIWQAIGSASLVENISVWSTSDKMLASTGAANSSQALIDALADLPEGDLILFVAASGEAGSTVAYFHTAYFGAPRRSVILSCNNVDRGPLFLAPIPSGSISIAAVVYYGMEPPPRFSGGRRVGPRLVVVPFSKPVAEVSDWKYFCR